MHSHVLYCTLAGVSPIPRRTAALVQYELLKLQNKNESMLSQSESVTQTGKVPMWRDPHPARGEGGRELQYALSVSRARKKSIDLSCE